MSARCGSATTRNGTTMARTTAPAASFSCTTGSATSSARVSSSTPSTTTVARAASPSRHLSLQVYTTSHRRSTCSIIIARSRSAANTQTPTRTQSRCCGSCQQRGRRRHSRSCRRSGKRRSARCSASGGGLRRSRLSSASCPSSVSTRSSATCWLFSLSHRITFQSSLRKSFQASCFTPASFTAVATGTLLVVVPGAAGWEAARRACSLVQ
mmetsp:Transcript_1328/g.2799  ORF Transcript_1328/g.2799 Transcript_1328/m.2799 type:complete len:211 (+) Transcript_1328:64-696(+)